MTFPPHILIANSPRVVAFFGRIARRQFYAFTLFCVTWVDDNKIEAKQKRHEYRHVMQWAGSWVFGIVVWLVLLRSWWMLALTPFTFNGLYAFAMFVAWLSGDHPYRDNVFERDARRHAGEPVE